MQGEDTMTGHESGLFPILKGVSVWILAAIANFMTNVTASQVAIWLSIVYTTLLIVSWFRKEFRSPPRQHRVTDELETIRAKKVLVVTEDDELPHPPHVPKE